MANFQIKAGTLFEDFETISDWTLSSAAVASCVATHIKTGSLGLKLQNNGAGVTATATATKTISADLSRAGAMAFWVYIENDPNTSGIHLTFSSTTDFSKKMDWSAASAVHEGWNFIVIGQDQWVNTGGESWTNTMIRLRVSVAGIDASTVGTAYFDSLYTGYYSRPKCVLFFDDFPDTAYTLAYPYMRQYGLRGTHAGVKNYHDITGKMTLAQINEMHDAGGWAIVNHTTTHSSLATDYGSDKAGMINNEIKPCYDWMLANGWTRLTEHRLFVFPSSDWNTTAWTALSDLGFLCGRANFDRVQGNFIDQVYVMAGNANNSGTTAAQIKAKIDRAIAAGASVFIYFHILRTPEDIQTTLDPAIFYSVIDYLAQKVNGNQIDAITFPEWYKGTISSRRII
jgi:peptidoglycan/xylan/chitin deacetylase (PgdA/CDA1 family)